MRRAPMAGRADLGRYQLRRCRSAPRSRSPAIVHRTAPQECFAVWYKPIPQPSGLTLRLDPQQRARTWRQTTRTRGGYHRTRSHATSSPKSLLEVGSRLLGRRRSLGQRSLQRLLEQRRGRATTWASTPGPRACRSKLVRRGALPNHLRLSATIIAAVELPHACLTWATSCSSGQPRVPDRLHVYRGSVSLLR